MPVGKPHFFEQLLQLRLPVSSGCCEFRDSGPKEIALADWEDFLQRFDHEIGERAIRRDAGLLRVEQELVAVQTFDGTTDSIANPNPAITRQ